MYNIHHKLCLAVIETATPVDGSENVLTCRTCVFLWRFCFCSEIQGCLGSGFCQQFQQKEKNSHSCGAFIAFLVKKCFKFTCIRAFILVVAGAFIDWTYPRSYTSSRTLKMISLSSKLWVRPMMLLMQQFCAQEVQQPAANKDKLIPTRTTKLLSSAIGAIRFRIRFVQILCEPGAEQSVLHIL